MHMDVLLAAALSEACLEVVAREQREERGRYGREALQGLAWYHMVLQHLHVMPTDDTVPLLTCAAPQCRIAVSRLISKQPRSCWHVAAALHLGDQCGIG